MPRRYALLLAALLLSPNLPAQQASVPSPTPDWQKAAGSKLIFAAATIRSSAPGAHIRPNFPNTPDDAYLPTPNDIYLADSTLLGYLQFAYKIQLSHEQSQALLATLPAWAASDTYVVSARSEAPATKDQMRLMMQSLLADRFHLALHFESRPTTVLALTVLTPGKLGPNLRPHAQGLACDTSAPIFPPQCDLYITRIQPDMSFQLGARNTTLPLLAASLNGGSIGLIGAVLGHPIVDQTSLTDRYDLILNWSPDPGNDITAANGRVFPSGIQPPIREALQKQLGLKLTETKTTLPTPVITHVDHPTDN